MHEMPAFLPLRLNKRRLLLAYGYFVEALGGLLLDYAEVERVITT